MAKKQTQAPIEQIVLGTLATAGILAAVAIAPGVGPALRLFGVGKRKPRKYYQNAISRLKQKGYVTTELRDGKKYVRITEKGKKKLLEYQTTQKSIRKPKRWDGKWRIVIFDIAEKKRAVRDRVRGELKAVGFLQLQRSVWIFPYECEEFVKLLKADKRIGKDILYIVAERVEYDRNYKGYFGL